MTTKIGQGAEAAIYSDYTTVTKDRFEKKYRHPELDLKLRRTRTRREAKILEKLHEAGFPAPRLTNMDEVKMHLSMDHVPGELVKKAVDLLEEKNDAKSYLKLFREIGEKVAVLHNEGIVHHDLTTSNMILHRDKNEIYFIDFGLSFFSEKKEDKAVDLHLLRHALESRHHRIWKECFEAVIAGYTSKADDAGSVLKRMEAVEKRGRYKGKH